MPNPENKVQGREGGARGTAAWRPDPSLPGAAGARVSPGARAASPLLKLQPVSLCPRTRESSAGSADLNPRLRPPRGRPSQQPARNSPSPPVP